MLHHKSNLCAEKFNIINFTKLIFKRLFFKLAAECKFNFSNSYYQQTDRFTMSQPLSINLSDIYITKPGNDVVVLLKPHFYIKYVDDIFNRKNLTRVTTEQLLSKN